MKRWKPTVGRFVNLLVVLMWLAISTRPDINNAVRPVARYCPEPKAISTGRQRLVFSHTTSRILLVLVLHSIIK